MMVKNFFCGNVELELVEVELVNIPFAGEYVYALCLTYTPNDIVVSLSSSLSAQNILHTITLKYIYTIIYTYNISSIIS